MLAMFQLLTLNKMFVPINVGKNHWCLVCIDIKARCLSYYDPLYGPSNDVCLRYLAQYFQAEVLSQKQVCQTKSWHLTTPRDMPRQTNGYDCGVFVLMYADYLSQKRPFNFTQDDTTRLRERICLTIMDAKETTKQTQVPARVDNV